MRHSPSSIATSESVDLESVDLESVDLETVDFGTVELNAVELDSIDSSIDSSIGSSPDRYLDNLAHLIADNGIRNYESDVARFLVRLRSVGLDGCTTQLLGDKSAAPVARERAFGSLVARLARVARVPSCRSCLTV